MEPEKAVFFVQKTIENGWSRPAKGFSRNRRNPLDGYKAELHPEFMSEANVFYTTIKNVNYPSKDEIRGVNKGSSDADKGSSGNHNTSLVDSYGTKKRVSKEDLWANIQSFCDTETLKGFTAAIFTSAKHELVRVRLSPSTRNPQY